MPRQEVLINMKGLRTNMSKFTAGQGSLVEAENVVIDSIDLLESRRGFKSFGTASSASRTSWTAFQADDRLYFGVGNSSDDLTKNIGVRAIAFDGFLLWNNEGSFIYQTTAGGTGFDITEKGYSSVYDNGGVYRHFTNLASNKYYISAGVERALDLQIALAVPAVGTGFLPNGSSVSYRLSWKRQELQANLDGKILQGVPSEIATINNAAGAGRDVDVTFRIPAKVIADITVPGSYPRMFDWYFQIYRTKNFASGTPDDEMQLVYERTPTSGECATGSITVTDTLFEDFRTEYLYTNPSQEGILQSNFEPPFCMDMTFYKDCVFYANTRQKQRFTFTLSKVDGGATGNGGIQNGDTITINSVVFTGSTAAENVATGTFYISNTGTVSIDIRETAKSIVKVLNGYSNNTTTYAYYVSGYDDFPGKILVERRDFTDTKFMITSSRTSAFTPILSSLYSEAETKQNRVYISKKGIYEAVPILNYIDIGTDEDPIVRIVALRDTIYIFKKSEGVYRIIGEDIYDFSAYLLDSETKLIGYKNLTIMDNVIFAFTEQGVQAFSDAGAELLSYEIEDELKPLYVSATFPYESFMISYHSDRKLLFYNGTKFYVFNTFTKSWTTWSIGAYTGIVNEYDDKMYYLDYDDPDVTVYQERKSFTDSDYADDEISVTISSFSGTTVTLVSTTGITVGDELVQGSNFSRITAVVDATDITVEDSITWSAAAATVYTPIDCSVKFSDFYGENPGIMKNYLEVLTSWEHMEKRFSITFTNNFNNNEVSTTIYPYTYGTGWGGYFWGGGVWGGNLNESNQNYRIYFPRNLKRALTQKIKLSCSRVYARFKLALIGLAFYPYGLKFNKKQ